MLNSFEKQRQAALNSYRPARLGRGGAVEARVTFNSPASPVTRSLADELDAEEDQRAPIDSLSFASQRIVERATAMFDVRSVVISLIE